MILKAAAKINLMLDILGQTEDRGADQAFADTQRLQQADQAAQPDASATRMDRITESRDDERSGADTALLAEGVEMGLNEGGGHAAGSAGSNTQL